MLGIWQLDNKLVISVSFLSLSILTLVVVLSVQKNSTRSQWELCQDPMEKALKLSFGKSSQFSWTGSFNSAAHRAVDETETRRESHKVSNNASHSKFYGGFLPWENEHLETSKEEKGVWTNSIKGAVDIAIWWKLPHSGAPYVQQRGKKRIK